MAFTRRKFIGVAVTLASICLSVGASTAIADTYPSKPIHMIVPFSPGGGTDILGRIVAQKLSESWGQPVVVENHPGASGVIGATMVSRSDPDGYTLLMAATGALEPPDDAKDKPYDVTDYFAPVGLVAAPPYILVVNSSVPADSVSELIALAKSRPGELNYASSGVGAASHLAAELFKAMAGVDMVHIPYKGMGQAVTDLISGQVSLMFSPSPPVLPHIESGKLKALAVSSAERSPLFPQFPTIAEAGVEGYEAVGWFGLFAPAGTPPGIVEKLNKEVVRLLQSPDVKERLASLGALPGETTPEEFTRFINANTEKWGKLMADAGIEK